MILGICDSPNVLEVMLIVTKVITIIKIVVPILLIVSLMVSFAKAVSNNDSDALEKAKKGAVSKVIAAVLVFLIPTFVDIIVRQVDPNSEYKECISDISRTTIDNAYNKVMEDLVSKAESSESYSDYSTAQSYLVNITDSTKKEAFQKRLNEVNAKIEEKKQETKKQEQTQTTPETTTPGTTTPGTTTPGTPPSDSTTPTNTPPAADPITNHVNVASVNTAIANAVKARGLYTREAVVSAATTLVNKLSASNYHVPYQLGGMYHRGTAWGLNPNWGTVITHNNKYVLSGLDCRNFVNWTFKQAGLSLIRGFGYEGAINNKYGDVYSNFGDGRPGDVIDANEHIMLIIKNDKSSGSYTIAQSWGGYGVQLKTYKYNELQGSIKYKVYNMDGVYSNTGLWCPEKSSYRPYSGSCYIPKSEFPSYYGF